MNSLTLAFRIWGIPLQEDRDWAMTTEGTTGEAGSKDVAVDACANCGKSGECDDVKLKNCTACYLTKYCSVDCQRAHRSEHKPACKLGAAEIKERPNFKPPKSLELSPEARILRSEVISLKATALPLPTRNREERQAKVGQLRVLYEKVEAYEILLEEERLEAALRAHEEKYPRPTMECPLCLSDIQYTLSVNETVAFNCCLKKAAEKGKNWARVQLACAYKSGTNGLERNEKKYLELFQLAAGDGDVQGLYNLGWYYMYRQGGSSINAAKGIKLFRQAAELGCEVSLGELAISSIRINNGFNGPGSIEAMEYLTLFMASQKRRLATGRCMATCELPALAAHIMGMVFAGKYGTDPVAYGVAKNLYLAKHYFEIAAHLGREEVYYDLGDIIEDIWLQQYSSEKLMNYPGACANKTKKAAASGDDRGLALVQRAHDKVKEHCSHCGMPASEAPKPLMKCGRCSMSYYCSKECQIKFWNAGHKYDCYHEKKAGNLLGLKNTTPTAEINPFTGKF
ncbi:hypothetical protein THAOC_07563 [Thalassiosira oceanica]|uniref:MYND-type domain-containing protein n=1 Tax=Thalassiosira oceanica TaxID=159749 RepID=K0TC38_THAOC|nr:hypothetical protein THAOC_07563 [Thalassiosira oceanica]|eukprot:EJK71031.1 hypothetical protein THAOC_07563 [Thalassiosira oceanica]